LSSVAARPLDQPPGLAIWRALGTRVSVSTADPLALSDAQALVERQLDEIDYACSRFRADSELTRVNRSAGRWVHVSSLFLQVLGAALRAASVTDGDVDPTIGRALRLAGYDRDFEALHLRAPPRAKFIATPGWQAIVVDSARNAVRVPHGVELDFGATGKAFAADRAAKSAFSSTGVGVMVNLGGDLALAGDPPPDGWAVRVTDDNTAAFDAPGQTISLASGGLATSSTTVRVWESQQGRLHHIFDPATGRPASVVWQTVSVAAASCVDANTASTAAIVRGDRAPGWLNLLELPARLVAVNGNVVRVGGWPES
jgi:thiamine biosynthesis lipoprotein